MTYAIETQGLTKMFGDFTAVDDITIKVREGTINGFIGPNGAGKTTTMKILIGALHPTNGSGTIKGHPLGSMEAKKLLGFSPEHPKFYGDMSGQRYLVYMGMVCGMSRSSADKRASELLKWLGIDAFADKNVQSFSAGMRQKLSLAQSLIHEPEVLILDEPTANLDPAGRLSIIKNLKELCHESNVTVFISSHILAELEKLVNDVTLINHGKLVVESGVTQLEEEVSGNRFIIKTSDNERLLSILMERNYVSQAEMDDNNVIHVAAEGDMTQFRKKITQDILLCDVWLELFTLESADLESVFMKLVGEGEEKQIVKQEKVRKHKWRFGR